MGWIDWAVVVLLGLAVGPPNLSTDLRYTSIEVVESISLALSFHFDHEKGIRS